LSAPGGLDIGRLVEAVAGAVGEREAIVWRGHRRTSYRQLTDRARRLARVLATAGLGARTGDGPPAPWEAGQDLALLHLTNCPEYLEAMVGCYLARVGPANVNYRYTVEEVAYLVADSDARAAVAHARFAPVLVEAAAVAGRTFELLLVVDDGSGTPLPPGATGFEDALAGADPAALLEMPSADDLYVVYTGGTTGRPKGVLWRQTDFLAGALGVTGDRDELAVAAAAADPARLRALPAPPLMHGAAHWNALSCLAGGGTVVLPERPDRVDPDDLLDTIEAERCTSLNIVGDAFAVPLADAQQARPRDLSCLRHVVSGGAILSPAVKARLVELVPGLRIVDIVGSSESGRQGIARGSGPARFQLPASAVVLSEDRRRVLRPGEHRGGAEGWLAATGPIPRGYLGDPEKTARTFPLVDGVRYVVAGDRARLLPDGGVELLGRDAVTINTGGEKVYAEEVEAALKSHPAVLDALVVGRPHERWGQEVVAVVALRNGQEASDEDLREVAASGLARYKLPKAFVRVDRVQRTASGKGDYAWARSMAAPIAGG
jgi:acyl-CoA synthetase (AMP-forming)/AMP-acid ligase II